MSEKRPLMSKNMVESLLGSIRRLLKTADAMRRKEDLCKGCMHAHVENVIIEMLLDSDE
jgi:hypothetical protein